MLRADADALRCDLAETYHIYDPEALPVTTVALLACGLRDNSRIKMKMTGAKVPNDILLLALAVDRLALLVWKDTKDGRKGRHRPPMITDWILNGDPRKKMRGDSFSTPDDFWSARQQIIERSQKHA